MVNLSKNFTLEEMCFSETAERLNIDNTPGEDEERALKFLCQNLLQPIRDKFGPVIVNSGYRGYQLNSYIGGAKMSQHTRGQAADLRFLNADILTVAKWLEKDSGLLWDQLIVEAWNPKQPSRGWLHLSLTEGANRRQVMTAEFRNGRANYFQGLPK